MNYFMKSISMVCNIKLRILGSLLIWVLSVHCSFAQSLPQPSSIIYHRVFKGTIHTYPITMYLVINQNDVNGYYYYDRVREPLDFSGTVRKDGMINLRVRAQEDYDNIIESFVGTLSPNNTISGTWVMLKNNKKLAFSVNEVTRMGANVIEKIYNFEHCFTNEIFTEKTCASINLTLPEIRSMSAMLNRNITMDLNEFICEDAYLKMSDCLLKDIRDNAEGDLVAYSVYYDVHLNEFGILSFTTDKSTEWSGSKYIDRITLRRNYSINTGNEITFQDMFMPGTLPFVHNLFKRKIISENELEAEESDLVELIEPDEIDFEGSFVITPKALLYFHPFTDFNGYSGFDEFMLPYTEIKRWINPNGPLGFVK